MTLEYFVKKYFVPKIKYNPVTLNLFHLQKELSKSRDTIFIAPILRSAEVQLGHREMRRQKRLLLALIVCVGGIVLTAIYYILAVISIIIIES